MKKHMAIATLLAAGTAFANAEDITVSSGRTALTSSNDNTYTVTDGQLFLNSWSGSSRTPTTFACNVVLNGSGTTGDTQDYAVAALRIHEQSTLSGTLTISASSNIWSSGASSISNEISGDVVTTNSNATLSIVASTYNSNTLLKFTGTSIELPTLDLSSGTLVAFDSQDITFSAITGSGTVTFNEGSSISITDTLTIQANSLTFGTVAVSESTTVSDIQDFFTGDVKSVSYDSAAKTLTVSTIPEPSAFGLLAGAGALALVASRRRRAK